MRPIRPIHRRLACLIKSFATYGYNRMTVNHFNDFADPVKGTCTNGVQSYWLKLKTFIITNRYTTEQPSC